MDISFASVFLAIPDWVMGAGSIVVVVFLALFAGVTVYSRILHKAEPGTALIRTGRGGMKINTNSMLVVPGLHKIETIDLTMKTVRISRRRHDSLSCKDGIRAEVEVDFYIKIDSLNENIEKVAKSIGSKRATDPQVIRELFEAKFSDALKTAGSKLTFDQLYQNRKEFKDEIKIALGELGEHSADLSGYNLEDVAIQYLEQLPLSEHDENNVLDSQGIKEIAERTAAQAEFANLRLREKEVRIAEQDQTAQTRQYEIGQDLAFKEESQKREIAEIRSRQSTQAAKTREEQAALEDQARIERERSVAIAEQKRQEELEVIERQKEQAIAVAEEEKARATEMARIQRETSVAEQLREKLSILEQTAIQEAEKIKAEERTVTVRAVEEANRAREIELIAADKQAQVAVTEQRVEADIKAYNLLKESEAKLQAAEVDVKSADMRAQVEIIEAEKEAKKELVAKNVSADMDAYRLRIVAEAKLEAAEKEARSATMKAEAIRALGQAEAEALRQKIEAENLIGKQKIMHDAISQIIPMIPEILDKLMAPAEKIDSIKFLNVNGMPTGNGASAGEGGNGQGASPMGGIVGTMMNVGIAMPMIKEVIKTIKSDDDYKDVYDLVNGVPGGKELLKYIEKFGEGQADANGSSAANGAQEEEGASQLPTVFGMDVD